MSNKGKVLKQVGKSEEKVYERKLSFLYSGEEETIDKERQTSFLQANNDNGKEENMVSLRSNKKGEVVKPENFLKVSDKRYEKRASFLHSRSLSGEHSKEENIIFARKLEGNIDDGVKENTKKNTIDNVTFDKKCEEKVEMKKSQWSKFRKNKVLVEKYSNLMQNPYISGKKFGESKPRF